MNSSIWNICDILENEYVRRVLAPNNETVDRWESDKLSYLREGFLVEEITDEHRGIVDSAVKEWKEREYWYLKHLFDSTDNFLRWFDSIHSMILLNKSIPLDFFEDAHALSYRISKRSKGIVVNMSWCRAFGSFLPLAIPELRHQLAEIGMTMSSIFYLEKIWKLRDKNPCIADLIFSAPNTDPVLFDDKNFEVIESFWLRAKELTE